MKDDRVYLKKMTSTSSTEQSRRDVPKLRAACEAARSALDKQE